MRRQPPTIDPLALLKARVGEVNSTHKAIAEARGDETLSEKRRRAAMASWGQQTARPPTTRIRIDEVLNERLHAEFGRDAGRALKYGAEWVLNHAQEVKMMLGSLALAFTIGCSPSPAPFCAVRAPRIYSPKTSIMQRDNAECLLCQLREISVVYGRARAFCDNLVAKTRLHNFNFNLSASGGAELPRPFTADGARSAGRTTARGFAHLVTTAETEVA